jgi:hypothetical protein
MFIVCLPSVCSLCDVDLYQQYIDELKANNAVELWDHYQVLNKSHVDITNFGEYFVTAIETLLVAQRKMHVKVC